MTPIIFPDKVDSWSGAGEVLGRLLPAMSPAQFVDEVCTAFNYTPLAKGSITISDDQLRDTLENAQLKLQRSRGTDVTIFSPRARSQTTILKL